MIKMRRKDRKIETADAVNLLTRCEYGVLSTIDNENQPYGVPLNYVYKNDCIYFHCALIGHKIDNIRNNPKVSFCVIGNTNVLQSEFSTEYESVIIFGSASEVQGVEKHNALSWLIEKYSPDFIEEGKDYIEKKSNGTKVIKIEIKHISGKRSKA